MIQMQPQKFNSHNFWWNWQENETNTQRPRVYLPQTPKTKVSWWRPQRLPLTTPMWPHFPGLSKLLTVPFCAGRQSAMCMHLTRRTDFSTSSRRDFTLYWFKWIIYCNLTAEMTCCCPPHHNDEKSNTTNSLMALTVLNRCIFNLNISRQ